MTSISASQSGGGIGVLSLTVSLCSHHCQSKWSYLQRLVTAFLLLRMYGLEHQQSSPQIPTALLRDPRLEPSVTLVSLLFADLGQNLPDLLHCRRRNPDKQASTPDRRNDVASTVRQQDQSQIWRVLLHRPAKRSLCIAGKVVGFVYYDDFEALFGCQIDLLGLRDFFEKVLDDDSIVLCHIRGSDFEMVVAGDYVEFEFAVARSWLAGAMNDDLGRSIPSSLEDSAIDLDLFNARSV